jgi:threonine/homoserine efflux transporter RhtA
MDGMNPYLRTGLVALASAIAVISTLLAQHSTLSVGDWLVVAETVLASIGVHASTNVANRRAARRRSHRATPR